MIKISDLRSRDVVNVLDGKRLGNIIDIDLDLETAKVVALVLPGRARGFCFLSKREEIIVPWHKIVKIGMDVILVEVPLAKEMDDYKKDIFSNEERY